MFDRRKQVEIQDVLEEEIIQKTIIKYHIRVKESTEKIMTSYFPFFDSISRISSCFLFECLEQSLKWHMIPVEIFFFFCKRDDIESAKIGREFSSSTTWLILSSQDAVFLNN